MCGICGIVATPDRFMPGSIRDMNRALGHRGPDDQGLLETRFTASGESYALALGHTRLSILDLSEAGHQPMSNSSGELTVSYNGEIYNYRELRRELEDRGHVFRSRTDTEVLLEGYRAWGSGVIDRLVGMFAFALFDARAGTLLLARDRLGIKPLYYSFREGALLFASELTALRAHPAYRAEVDRRSLGLFLQYGYVPGPGSIDRHTHRLMPGHTLLWERGQVQVRRYWNLQDEDDADRPADFDAAVDGLGQRLGEAVEQRMISDVPLGAFLSGGIDSSAVVSLMQERSSQTVQTFTIGIDESGWDEAQHARAVAQHLGTEHHELRIESESAAQVARDLPLLYDEPFGDTSAIPMVLLSRFARQHVTVALSGDGGDELLGGYWHHDRLARLAPWQKLPGLLRRAVARIPSWPVLRRLGDLSPLAAEGETALAHALVHRSDGAALPAIAGSENVHPSETWLAAFEGLERGDAIHRAMFADAAVYLPDDILTKVDRASMSVGLEARVPVLDHRVVRYALRLPLRWIWRDGLSKAPLREILYRRVPRELVDRPKRGFGLPIDALLKDDLARWTRHYLSRDRIGEEGLLDPDGVQAWLGRRSPRSSRDLRTLWFLICFERWFASTHRGEEAA